MMKNIYKYITVLLVALTALACSGDLGNYDYVQLDEPLIEGVEDRSVLMFSRLTMTPQLGAETFKEPDYSFEWKVIDSNGDKEPVIIGTGASL
ncbi:MAG: hypothetical protein IIX08_03200, partial [Bacteroidales bacterium]|nr:hypothetical protein [Bacteroidales bacterium]